MASVFSEAEWVAIWDNGDLPEIIINVWNCQASIMILKPPYTGEIMEYEDITEEIPNGKSLAVEAVEAAGGAINMSGYYPPSQKIISAVSRLAKRRIKNEKNT